MSEGIEGLQITDKGFVPFDAMPREQLISILKTWKPMVSHYVQIGRKIDLAALHSLRDGDTLTIEIPTPQPSTP